jgi:hypothetical protein
VAVAVQASEIPDYGKRGKGVFKSEHPEEGIRESHPADKNHQKIFVGRDEHGKALYSTVYQKHS